MTLGKEIHWSTPDMARLFWENWGDQYAIYDALSGETHLLNKMAALALQQLDNTPLTAGELCKQLGELIGSPCDSELLRQTEQLLLQFDHIGLIEKCRP